jgi:DNA invertase Pin-like site-specific DNA recombinase
MAETGGIIRVSTKAQALDSDSPANQRQVLASQGATRFYEDVGSGYSLQRRRSSEGWRQLLDDIQSGRIGRLLATDLSRAARRDALLSELIELCDAHGVEFLAGGMAMSHGTAHQWYSAKQIGLVAELYSRDLSDRIRRGRQAALDRGVPAFTSHHLPWHLMREPGTRHGVIPHPERWNDARHVVTEYIHGRSSLSQLSRWVHERHGLMTHHSALQKWLRSPVLEGHYATRTGQIVLASCLPALLTAEEATLVRRRLEANRKRSGSTTSHTVYALTGLCRCLHCGNAMSHTTSRHRPIDKVRRYLRCTVDRGCRGYNRKIRAAELEEAVLFRLDQELLAQRSASTTSVKAVSPEVAKLRQRVGAMEALLADLDSPGIRADLAQAKARLEQLEQDQGPSAQLVDQAKAQMMRGINAWMARPDSERNADLLVLVERATVDTTCSVQGSIWQAALVREVLLR